jgi:hypothetical protein
MPPDPSRSAITLGPVALASSTAMELVSSRTVPLATRSQRVPIGPLATTRVRPASGRTSSDVIASVMIVSPAPTGQGRASRPALPATSRPGAPPAPNAPMRTCEAAEPIGAGELPVAPSTTSAPVEEAAAIS